MARRGALVSRGFEPRAPVRFFSNRAWSVSLAQPAAFHGVRDDLVRFMRLSRAVFFADGPRASGDAAWLVELGRRCRDAERGLA